MTKKMTVFCGVGGFCLIPYPMCQGQSPSDILQQYRYNWVPLERRHSIIPTDVSWGTGDFDEVDVEDFDAVLTENRELRDKRILGDLRRESAERLAGEIWLHQEDLALKMAVDASILGFISIRAGDDEWGIRKESDACYDVSLNGQVLESFVSGMEAGRHIVRNYMMRKVTPIEGETQ